MPKQSLSKQKKECHEEINLFRWNNLYMRSFCNLLLLFCCNYFIRKSKIASNSELLLYLGYFCKKIFFFLYH